VSIPCESPAYGVLIECVMEDDPRYGSTSWIDLLTVETSEDIQEIIDSTTGRDQDPYPDSWNEEGTFEVSEVRGLGPRLSAYAKDVVGPFVDTLTALATALQILSPEQRGSFLAWAELSSWPPGYLPDTGGHTSGDVVEQFLCETVSPTDLAAAASVTFPALSDEQEFGLKKLEFGLRQTIQRKPDEVVLLCVSQSRLLRQSEKLIADMQQQIESLQLLTENQP